MTILRIAVWLLMPGLCATGQQTKTWDGFVTDSHCGTHCQRTSTMSPDRAYVRRCIRKGSKYGLWTGDQFYVLMPQAKAAMFPAENVQVVGRLVGDTIEIHSILPISAHLPSVGK